MNQELPRLYIPGPVEVSEDSYEAFRSRVMAHRSDDFRELYAATQPVLKTLFGTQRPVYLMTSPSSGVMEASLRNLSRKRVLSCCCGAFSERWHQMALDCGKAADRLSVPWGQVITPELLLEALGKAEYDLVTLVHCETSTGVLNPLKELASVVNEFPDVLLAVDTVSSFSAVPLELEGWGVDVILAGVQKALALPPGMTVAAVSERALQRAAVVPGRGFFLDFLEWEKNARDNMTVATPSIGHVYALVQKMQEIEEEGIVARFYRYEALRQFVLEWAKAKGVELAAPEGFRTPTLTCFKNTQGWDLPRLIDRLKKESGFLFDGGYGQWKGKSFRISHMGNETLYSIRRVLLALEKMLDS